MRKSKTDPSLIPVFVGEGLSDLEIANRMGWTVGTLRVRCSQLKISLRRKKVASGKQVVLRRAIVDQLHQRAELMGVSISALASDLLEVIARDSLYDAVLDLDDRGLTRRNASVN